MKLQMFGGSKASRSVAFVAASLLALAMARPAQAQVTLGLGGGVTFPAGNLSNAFSSGFNALADLGIRVPVFPLGFRGDLMFNQLPVKNSVGSGHTQIYSATANVVAQAPGMVVLSPYLIAGVGYYDNHYSTKIFSNGSFSGAGSLSTSTSNVGVNGGVGVKLSLPGTGIGLFGEARYHYVFQSGNHYSMVPITVGVNF